jgi:hypothetical protein
VPIEFDRRHLLVPGFSSAEEFAAKGFPRSPPPPAQNRARHGAALLGAYRRAVDSFEERRKTNLPPITEDIGIYLRIEGHPGCDLPLDSLDTRDFSLRSVVRLNDVAVAVVFVPEARRHVFEQKARAYLSPKHDSKKGQPKNRNLIDSISDIRLANLEAFFTDGEPPPGDRDEPIWWEVWLKAPPNQGLVPLQTVREFAERVGAQTGATALHFYELTVSLIKCSVAQLEQAIELISTLAELRRAKQTPAPFLTLRPTEQRELAESISQRLRQNDTETAVCVLDTGVNFNHPILSSACREDLGACWDQNWPLFDVYDPIRRDRYNDHGSRQAGLILLGHIQSAPISNEPIEVPFVIESGRLMSHTANDPELYGAIVRELSLKHEQARPEYARIFSLAITAQTERLGGQPSSWSSEIDLLASGADDDKSRMFVVSGGNNRQLVPNEDYWAQVQTAQIEDPAQAWNVLTVGAYTNLTTNDDPTFAGWAPAALGGDVAPATRSSIDWEWREQAPVKPDVVDEGGNRLISPGQTEITNADVVSLITTSGRSAGQLFETTGDTSAATALISRTAGILTSENPDLWPETIRGLIVHSARWTDRMNLRHAAFAQQLTPKVAKERMLSIVGYGVPNLERARRSATNAVTLIDQHELQPFAKSLGAEKGADAKLNEMVLYELPWPSDVLAALGEHEVRLRITLSYFVEPNPGRRGYKQRYNYRSHGLRFEVIRPDQSLENFRAFVNGMAVDDEYGGPQGDGAGWFFGPQLRTRGSIHTDTWTGTGAKLATMNAIAVYPVGGWWKYRVAGERWQRKARYTLLASIETDEESADLYSPIENQIQASVLIDA